MKRKITTLSIITFTFFTLLMQFNDVKNFVTNVIFGFKNENILSLNTKDELLANPFLTASELENNLKNENFPGPLDVSGTDIQKEEPVIVKGEVVSENQKIIEKKQSNFSLSEIIMETNIFRTQNNIEPLKMETKLNNSAKEKLDDMFARGYFEHISPQGISVEDLADEFGYNFLIIGENLALGNFKTAKDVVIAWSESPPHRQNMLDTRYKNIGVAIRRDYFNGHLVTIIVQHFGKSIDSCPSFSKKTKKDIDNIQIELQILRDMIGKLKTQIDQDFKEDLVEEHNKFVVEYNKKLNTLKILVEEYNRDVIIFNDCIAKNTV